MINSLIVLSYINLGLYDEAYNVISKINWHNITYIYFGYYSILLNLYFDNVLEAKRIFKSVEKTRNKHLNKQILISSELLKMADGNNFDREIINNSKLNLVILVCEKYGK